jgi:hypothetical protein
MTRRRLLAGSLFLAAAASCTFAFIAGARRSAMYDNDSWEAGVDRGALYFDQIAIQRRSYVFRGWSFGPAADQGSLQWLPSFLMEYPWISASLPLWIPAALGVAATFIAWRDRPGPHLQCPHCRYDLRGLPRLPDQPPFCPECGSASGGPTA